MTTAEATGWRSGARDDDIVGHAMTEEVIENDLVQWDRDSIMVSNS